MEQKTITITTEELTRIITEAYTEGARQLKVELGLDDEHAIEDIKDLRSLLSALKEARNIALKTLIKYVTVAAFSLMFMGLYFKIKG